MSMIYVLRQASDATIEELLEDPQRIELFVGMRQPEGPKRPGWFARLFGRKSPSQQSELARERWQRPDDVEETNLDKAWHGIHYLLTGSDWKGDPPAAFLLNGGTEIGDVDVGYGPARALTASQTAEVAQYLAGVDEQSLRDRFDPQQMMALHIYPTIWDRDPEEDDTLGYLIEYFGLLKEFVAKTAGRGYGMVVYLG